MTSPVNGPDERLSSDEIIDLRSLKAIRVALPICLVLISPITIAFSDYHKPWLYISFFLGVLWTGFQPPSAYFESIFYNPPIMLVVSLPYLLLGIVSAWQLHRLSIKRSTPRRVLIVISLAAAVWIIFNLTGMFYVQSSGEVLIIGWILPLPIAPVAAILSRTHIMELTRRIESQEKQDAGLV
jgi:hypothetical protein